ncbi:MAG: hypothetical protein LBU81_03915 [Methanosarcinales archaeon]|jgi:hypothetical protein|nr:hypothetical protein [Methanosarcinales archaeon]
MNLNEIKIENVMTQILKQIAVPFIECCVMSFIWIILYPFEKTFDILFLFIKLLRREDVHIGLTEELNIFNFLFIVSLLGFSIIIYIILKKKYNFKIKDFFYSIGFTLCCVLLFLSLSRFLIETIPWLSLSSPRVTFTAYTLSALSFTLFYYTYATLLQSDKEILLQNNKKISKGTFHLAFLTVISYAVLIVFEIINDQIPVFGISLLFFGFYFVCCLFSKKIRISLRQIAWIVFLPAYISLLYVYARAPF